MALGVGDIDVPIIVYDKFGVEYTDVNAMSGFTGELSEFTAVAQLSAVSIQTVDVANLGISYKNVSWEWGDGTTGFGVSASKVYNQPGVYNVKCIMVDKDGHSHESTNSPKISAYNYFGDQINWYTDSTESSQTEVVTAGRISNPLNLERFNSWQSYNTLSATGYTINLYASGSESEYISRDQYLTDKYSHLRKTHRFVKSNEDQTPVHTLSTTNTEVYFKAVESTTPGGTLTRVTSADESSVFVGTSGYNTIHYMDDFKSPQVNLFATLDTSKFPTYINNIFNLPRSTFPNEDLNYYHQNPSVLCIEVAEKLPTKLLITSNGISGFVIGTNKWEKTPISYTISFADEDNNVLKCYPPLSAGNQDQVFRVEHGMGGYTDENTEFYSNTAVDFPSYGGLSLFAIVTGTSTNQTITAECTVQTDTGGLIELTGTSNTFNVLPASGSYNISKYSEDYDFAETLRSYTLQDTISENSNFIDWFLTNIFGTNTSDPETLGKTIYEKIDNFVANRSDIDVCNVDALYSLAKSVGFNFEDYRYDYPAGIKRLVDLLSINHRKLFGFRDNTNDAFNRAGYTLNDTSLQGRNLGTKLTTNSYIVSAGTPIIANQLFNDEFRFINTMVISGADGQDNYSSTYGGLTSYDLSAYDASWGWGLSLPDGGDIATYYDFYSYVENNTFPLSSSGIVEGVINFADTLTTLNETNSAISTWNSKYGIVDNIFDYRFHEGLGLIGVDVLIDPLTAGVEGDFTIGPSPSPTPSVTPSITPTQSTTPTPSVTPSITPTRSVTPSITPTPSVTPSPGTLYWEDITTNWEALTSNWEDT